MLFHEPAYFSIAQEFHRLWNGVDWRNYIIASEIFSKNVWKKMEKEKIIAPMRYSLHISLGF
jgi:hypothetical protein